MTDRIAEKLRALQPDVDRVGLADSESVRRRGNRRTRNQSIGAGVAVVALVAGVVGLAGGLTTDRGAVPPAEEPTVSTSEPTVSTSERQLLDLAAAPFLSPAELTGFPGYDRAGPFGDARQEPDIRPEQCAVRPGGWEAGAVRSTRYYQDGSEAEIREYVLRFDSVSDAAQAALKRAYADLATCLTAVDPSEGTLSTRNSEVVPGLDGAVRHSRLFIPEVASEPSYYEVATAHRANVVVVLEWQASGNPGEDSGSGWVWTADRLRTALDQAAAPAG